MAKFAISFAPFISAAVVNMLDSNGYTNRGGDQPATAAYLLVNTDKGTYKGAAENSGRTTYNPTSQFTAIQALIAGRVTATATPVAAPTRSLVSAPTASASTPVATAVDSRGTQLHVGDTVTMANTRKTKAKFRVAAGNYVINLITASGKIGLAGLPNDQYLPKRATKVSGTTTNTAIPNPRYQPVATPAPAAKPAVDAAGNILRVGDTVLVVSPRGKRPVFNLRTNGVATIASITSKGALGFAFDPENQFLAKRFQKVTLADPSTVRSGDLVVSIKDSRDRKFALTQGQGYTFRGKTVEKGNFILDGKTEHQYAPSRFKVVKPVGTIR